MTFYIISDVHGSAANLKKFLSIFDADDKKGDDAKIILLGDIYNHGPRNPFPDGYAPMQVAEMLNARKGQLIAIKGNCDSEVDEMISDFKIIPSLTVDMFDRRVLFTHGHKCNPQMPAAKVDAVFYGHFHRPSETTIDGVRYICVGAIGLSPNGVDKSYARISDGKVDAISLDSGKTLFSVEL